mgnify:CR=1 FL=1
MGKKGSVVNIARSEIVLKTGEVIRVLFSEDAVRAEILLRTVSLQLASDLGLGCLEIPSEVYFPIVRGCQQGERAVFLREIETVRPIGPQDNDMDYSVLDAKDRVFVSE